MSLEGRQLGEFEILERLGQGGMGAVFKARQKSLRRTVALKRLQAALTEDGAYVARFQQEATAAAGLSHPNLVQVYSAGEDEGLHWFAMEYVEGESAQARLRREGKIDPVDAVAIVIHVATALEYGWRKAALIHRDIKPDNIFLSSDGEVKLGDLGLAKSAEQTQGLTTTGAAMGTPNYISPEQAQATSNVDLRADIYSLGCTLYHLLSGQPPYSGGSMMAVLLKHVSAPVPNLLDVWPECPPKLAALVMKMMLKDPEARPQSYAEVIGDLREVYDSLNAASGPETVTTSPPPSNKLDPANSESAASAFPPRPGSGKSHRKVYAGFAIGAIALAAVAFFLRQPTVGELGGIPLAPPKHETPASSATTKSADKPGADKPAPAQKAETWRSLLGEPSLLSVEGAVAQESQGLRLTGFGKALTKLPQRDGAVRMRVPFGGMRAALRARMGESTWYELNLDREGKTAALKTVGTIGNYGTPLISYPLPRTLAAGQFYELELRAIGNVLTVKYDGKVLGSILEDNLTEGRFGVASANDGDPTLVTSLEMLATPFETWNDVLADPGNHKLSGRAERVADGVQFTGAGSVNVLQDGDIQRDGAVRMRAIFGGRQPELRARLSNDATRYLLTAKEDNFITLGFYTHLDKRYTTLRNFRPSELLKQGKEYELELRVVGSVLTASVNGEVLGSVSDGNLPEGRFDVGIYDTTGTPVIVKGLEFLDLDAIDSATKDTPFVNGLGMNFTTVPITGGPNAGQRLLVSVWHTRVQDYAAYASAKSVDDSWKRQGKDGVSIAKEPTHPVVGVSWDDAQAFCQWLTDKETAEGTLPRGLKYRLPTDEEWSWAVGLPPESGSTPEGKDQKNRVDFPWGRDNPPQGKVGNYADETFRAKFLRNEKSEEKTLWMEGYMDGYETTSPVGSFPANSFGLHDMGGNVWQWCENWFDATRTSRVLRGGSWENRGTLSSFRNQSAPGRRTNAIGFRCVLVADR